MIRTFQRHIVRKQMELSESLWQFEPCSGPYGGQRFLMAVPGCWESHPLFADYRGEGIYRKRFQAEGDIQIECKGVSHTAVLVLDGQTDSTALQCIHTVFGCSKGSCKRRAFARDKS